MWATACCIAPGGGAFVRPIAPGEVGFRNRVFGTK